MGIREGDRIFMRNGLSGVIKYIGEVEGQNEEWVGLELDKPEGKNNGSINGKKYFECKDKYGIFLKYNKLMERIKELDAKKSDTKALNSNSSLGMSVIEEKEISKPLQEEKKEYKTIKRDDAEPRKYSNLTNKSILFDDKEYSRQNIDGAEEACSYQIEKLKEENRKIRELLENTIRKWKESLSSVQNRVEELKKKLNQYKMKNKTIEEEGRVRSLVSSILESEKRGDRKKMLELYRKFKEIMEKHEIKVE